jgi:hypothetical protein
VDRNSNAAAWNYNLQHVAGGPNAAEYSNPSFGCFTGASSRGMHEMVLQQISLSFGP